MEAVFERAKTVEAFLYANCNTTADYCAASLTPDDLQAAEEAMAIACIRQTFTANATPDQPHENASERSGSKASAVTDRMSPRTASNSSTHRDSSSNTGSEGENTGRPSSRGDEDAPVSPSISNNHSISDESFSHCGKCTDVNRTFIVIALSGAPCETETAILAPSCFL